MNTYKEWRSKVNERTMECTLKTQEYIIGQVSEGKVLSSQDLDDLKDCLEIQCYYDKMHGSMEVQRGRQMDEEPRHPTSPRTSVRES